MMDKSAAIKIAFSITESFVYIFACIILIHSYELQVVCLQLSEQDDKTSEKSFAKVIRL